MKKEELDYLLEKYYNGESSEDEDQLLIIFFSNNDVPPGYEAEKEIFAWLKNTDNIPEPSDYFEERIISSLGHRKSPVLKRILIAGMSAAAALLIIAGTWMYIDSKRSADTFNDPALAYNETMKILAEVSGKLNLGMSAMDPFARANVKANESVAAFRRSSLSVQKNLEGLEYLQDAFRITNAIEKHANN